MMRFDDNDWRHIHNTVREVMENTPEGRPTLLMHPSTWGEIRAACEELVWNPATYPEGGPTTLFGCPAMLSNLAPAREPRLKLSPRFKWCSEEFRRQMNNDLLAAFGTRPAVYVLMDQGRRP